MRLALLIETFCGGGVEHTMSDLADMLARRHHDVTLLACRDTAPLAEQSRRRLRVHVLDADAKGSGRWHGLYYDGRSALAQLLPVLPARHPPDSSPISRP